MEKKPRPTYYCVGIKRPKGRVWYRADTASCGDRAFISRQVDVCQERWPTFSWRVLVLDGAVFKYMPYDMQRATVERV